MQKQEGFDTGHVAGIVAVSQSHIPAGRTALFDACRHKVKIARLGVATRAHFEMDLQLQLFSTNIASITAIGKNKWGRGKIYKEYRDVRL